MRLYSGTTAGLVDDSAHNRLAAKLSDAFFASFGFKPHEPEVRSWRESLRAVSQVFQTGELLNHGVILEYTLPMCSKRLDCLVTGNDDCRRPNAVIIELKQGDRCEDGGGANEVVTWVGGANRDVLHPSAQVRQYKMYLEDSHTAFSADDPINLSACSYLHNYPFEQSDVLFADRFQELLRDCPLFTADDVENLIGYLQPRLKRGDDGDIRDRVERSRYRASKKLLDHVSRVIKGKSEYVLLDEQLVVFDRIVKDAQDGTRSKKKSVVIVKGGPGTGKSVIALKLLGDLSATVIGIPHHGRRQLANRGLLRWFSIGAWRERELIGAQQLDRMTKAHSFDLHHPVDHRASRPAGPQTVPEVLLGADHQTGLVIVMEGTEANQVRSVALELDPARLRQTLQRHLPFQPLDLTLRDARHLISFLWVFRVFPKTLSSLFSLQQGGVKISFDKLSCQAIL